MHRVWLGDIYEWAGEYRHVNVAKGGFMFAAAKRLRRIHARRDTHGQPHRSATAIVRVRSVAPDASESVADTSESCARNARGGRPEGLFHSGVAEPSAMDYS
jgi:hypothetical protein